MVLVAVGVALTDLVGVAALVVIAVILAWTVGVGVGPPCPMREKKGPESTKTIPRMAVDSARTSTGNLNGLAEEDSLIKNCNTVCKCCGTLLKKSFVKISLGMRSKKVNSRPRPVKIARTT